MKKIFIIILTSIFLFSSCEKDFDNIVDTITTSYQVKSLSQIKEFTYSDFDTILVINIKIDNSKNIKSVWANIISSTNDQLNSNPIILLDNGKSENKDDIPNDNIFTN